LGPGGGGRHQPNQEKNGAEKGWGKNGCGHVGIFCQTKNDRQKWRRTSQKATGPGQEGGKNVGTGKKTRKEEGGRFYRATKTLHTNNLKDENSEMQNPPLEGIPPHSKKGVPKLPGSKGGGGGGRVYGGPASHSPSF